MSDSSNSPSFTPTDLAKITAYVGKNYRVDFSRVRRELESIGNKEGIVTFWNIREIIGQLVGVRKHIGPFGPEVWENLDTSILRLQHIMVKGGFTPFPGFSVGTPETKTKAEAKVAAMEADVVRVASGFGVTTSSLEFVQASNALNQAKHELATMISVD